MKSKHVLILLLITLFIAGCASLPVSKEIIDFSIVPDKGIKAGTIVTVKVKTTKEVEKVVGYIDVPGSPKLNLKYNEKTDSWGFKYMIPLTYIIPKGEYMAKVEIETKSGEKGIAEKKISTY